MSLPPLNVKIGADTGDLDRSLNRSQQVMRRFALGIAGAAAAVGTAMLAMTRRSMENADQLAKQARQIGLTTDRFQAMSLVAGEAGVSTQALTNSLGIMQRNIVELERGTQTQVRAFEALGLSIADLQGLNADEQFERIAERLNAIQDPAQRTATAMEVFGRSGREVINMLDDYGRKVQDATEFQRRFGIAISQTDAEQIERANDAVGRLREAFGGLGNLMAVAVAPAVERFANGLINLAGIIADRVNPPTDDLLDLLRDTPGLMDDVALAGPGLESSFDGVGRAAREAGEDVGLFAGALRALYDKIEEGRAMGGLAADITGGMGQFGGVTGRGDGDLTGETEDFITNLPPIEFPSGGVEVNQADSNTVRPRRAPSMLGEPLAIPSIGGGSAVADQFASRLEALQEGLQTEQEVIDEWYAESLETLQEARARELLTEEEYWEAKARLQEEYNNRSQGLMREELQMRQQTFTAMTGLLTQFGQRSKAAAKAAVVLNAAQRVSEIMASTASAAMSAAAATPGGPAAKMAAAARVSAYGKVQAGIAAASAALRIGGGSGGGGGAVGAVSGGGASATTSAQQQAPTTTFQFTLQNDPMGFGEQFARQMVEQLNEAQRNGGQVRGVLA